MSGGARRGGGRLTVVGDALLDCDLTGAAERLAPDAPVPVVDVDERVARPGGAALAAVLAAADGRPVTLVTALAGDAPGRELAALLGEAGVEVVDLGLHGTTPEKVRVRASGHPLVRLDWGGPPVPGSVGPLGDAGRRALAGAAAVLVADYGRGVTSAGDLRAALEGRPLRQPLVWDPHPRGADPVAGARLVTPNRSEAGLDGDASLAHVARRAAELAARWEARGVALTLGARGAVLVEGEGPPLAVPAPVLASGDPCGAGDRFASAAAGCLADGGLTSEAVTVAVAAASAFVAGGGAAGVRVVLPGRDGTGGGPAAVDLRDGPAGEGPAAASGGAPGLAEARVLAGSVRAAGGTVVATGGCFDLLHAGHVSVLESARALGDCLVVCLNSDDSVRRLKGAGRPLQPAADRARVLQALGCVDAVVVFDEDTPEVVLDGLRPDVFAKGADYSLARLPEAALLATWGGQAVVLPYLEGRSTTRLVKEALTRGPS